MIKLTMTEFQRNLNYLYAELKEKKIELQKRKTQDAPISELVNLATTVEALDSLIEMTLESYVEEE